MKWLVRLHDNKAPTRQVRSGALVAAATHATEDQGDAQCCRSLQHVGKLPDTDPLQPVGSGCPGKTQVQKTRSKSCRSLHTRSLFTWYPSAFSFATASSGLSCPWRVSHFWLPIAVHMVLSRAFLE